MESLISNIASPNIIIFDDASENPNVFAVIEKFNTHFERKFLLKEKEKTKTRGRLHQNIQNAYEYAIDKGYEYLFLVQEDMQFVRPFDEHVQVEYSNLFENDESIIQVDPRFLRRLGEICVRKDIRAYSFHDDDFRRSYADAGILSIQRLSSINWQFESSERANKYKACKYGLKRIFPFTPIFMHIPYPSIYRKGRIKMKFPSPLVKRGNVKYEPFTKTEIEKMDRREINVLPYSKNFLKPKNLGILASIHYRFAPENKIFC